MSCAMSCDGHDGSLREKIGDWATRRGATAARPGMAIGRAARFSGAVGLPSRPLHGNNRGLVLLLSDKDLVVLIRQSMNGKVKDDHLQARYDEVARAIS